MNLDFLCIGVQKAGTTWLDRILRSHPDVWIPATKELHYYDEQFVPFVRNWSAQHRVNNSAGIVRWQQGSGNPDPRIIAEAEFIGRAEVDADWYRELFAMAPPGNLKGEVTPEYCLCPDEGVELMMADNPHAHYFLMLREPVSRDLSHLRMIIGNEGYDLEGPVEAYEPRFETYMKWLDHEKRGDYLPILERWQRLIDPAHFHVLFFEQIKTDPEGLSRRLCSTLGVDPAKLAGDAREVVHKGPKFEIPDRIVEQIRERHREAIAVVKGEFELAAELW